MSEEKNAYTAFISHSSEDREKAEAIRESLEANGLRCWIAPRDIRAGHEYADEIIYGIRESRCLVLVLSDAANKSSFVRREVERAVSYRKPVFPIRIEDVLPSPSLEFFVSSTHWIDAWTGQLVKHAANLARDMKDERIVEFAAARSRKIARRRQLPRWILGIAGFCALIAAIVLGNRLSSSLGDQGRPAGGDAHWFDEYSKKLGINIAALKKSDFQVILHKLSIPPDFAMLEVKSSEGLQKLLAYTQKSYAFDGGTYTPFFSFDKNPGIVVPAGAKTISIKFELDYANTRHMETLGPFSYPVQWGSDASPAGNLGMPFALPSRQPFTATNKPPAFDVEKAKDALLARSDWLYSSPDAALRMDAGRSEIRAVQKIHLGDARDRLDRVVDLSAFHKLPYKYDSTRQQAVHIQFRPGVEETYAQLEFTDGTRSDIRNFKVPDSHHNFSDTYRKGIALSAVDVREAPLLFVEFAPFGLEFLPDYPPCTRLLTYSFDGGEMLPAQNFKFRGPVKDSTVRVAYKQEDGSVLGPFQYLLKNPAEQLQNLEKSECDQAMPKIIACRRLNFTYPHPTGKNSEDSQRVNQINSAMSRARLPVFDKAPSIICFANWDIYYDSKWKLVRTVRLGKQRNDLSTTVTVNPELVKKSTRGRAPDGLTLSNPWEKTAVFPVDTKEIYAQFVFNDGSLSEVRQLRIVDFDETK